MGVSGLHDSHARVSVRRSHNVALTSISFKDRPFLYDINGGSFKISLSNGCFLNKCHLLMMICFKLGTDGWYCVTKGKIRLFSPHTSLFI